MLRNKIVITPLEEDLQKIGLLPTSLLNENYEEEMEEPSDDESDDELPMDNDEDADQDDDMNMDDESEESEESDDDEESDEDEDEDQGDDDFEDEDEFGDEEDEDEEQGDEDFEDDADEDEDNFDDEAEDGGMPDDSMEDSDNDSIPDQARWQRESMSRATPSRKPAKAITESTSNNRLSRVNNLLEEVQGIVGNIHAAEKKEALHSFANISVISEMLAKSFRRVSRELEETQLKGVARTLSMLSEEAGNVALTIKANKTVPQMESLFKKHMSVLLDSLDLYEDIQETMKQLDECPDDMESEESEGSDDDVIVKPSFHIKVNKAKEHADQVDDDASHDISSEEEDDMQAEEEDDEGKNESFRRGR